MAKRCHLRYNFNCAGRKKYPANPRKKKTMVAWKNGRNSLLIFVSAGMYFVWMEKKYG